MGLYVGNSQKIIILNNQKYTLFIPSLLSYPIVDGKLLLTADGYILKDSNGLYLTIETEDK